jgi:hypothetical protein
MRGMRLSQNYLHAPSDKANVAIALIRMSWIVVLMITALLMLPSVSGKFDPYVDNGGTLVGQYRIPSSPSLLLPSFHFTPSLPVSPLLLLVLCSALLCSSKLLSVSHTSPMHSITKLHSVI